MCYLNVVSNNSVINERFIASCNPRFSTRNIVLCSLVFIHAVIVYAGLGYHHYAKEIQGAWLFVCFSSYSWLFNIYTISGMSSVSQFNSLYFPLRLAHTIGCIEKEVVMIVTSLWFPVKFTLVSLTRHAHEDDGVLETCTKHQHSATLHGY